MVERPASVVKELVENALDAGAKSISVTIEGAGRTLVDVADDGAGIPEGELKLAVERHATSKLVTAQDLFRIATLGFRGEALASIGSVARMTIVSRSADAPSGARLRVEGGSIGKVEKAGVPFGTDVRVEDLFYNVPARLKFLKQDTTERRAIDALLTRYALAYPHVRFKLSEGENISLHTAGDGDRRAILAAFYGVETARQMMDILAEEGNPSTNSGQSFRLEGFISPPSLTRSNRREMTFFINGRWVQDTPLVSALLQAYHTLLMVRRFPLAVIFIEVPPGEVDVNVHPAKAEVRFRAPDRVFSFVQHSVRKALLASTPVPQVTPPSLWGRAAGRPPEGTPYGDAVWILTHDEQAFPGAASIESPSAPQSPQARIESPQASISNFPLLRLIGQIAATYLVAEGPDGLYLIDQHAAHERVLFEKLMSREGAQALPSQALLTPAVVHFPPESARLLEEQLPILEQFGFHVEPFGSGSFQVRAMPALFGDRDPSATLRALVEDFEEDETPLQNEREALLAGRVCKRMAVKAGQVLSLEEQRTLLADLEGCASPRTCPHGRPTMIQLSVDTLERQFGRKGAR